jgi:hypothetical protein
MLTLDVARWQAYRARTFRLPPYAPLTSFADALEFVRQRGFVFFWPVKGIDLPSLWVAVAGERAVAEAHDDPGHVTWGWKDEALGKRLWYYAKILRRKGTFISLELTPFFYAISENYGNPEEDYLLAYEEGRLTQAAKQVYEALLRQGPLDTLSLRKAARLSNARDSEFNRALEDLQADFKILPVGVAEAGAWQYAYRYDLTARHLPELPEQARFIGEAEARQTLVEAFFASVGAAPAHAVGRLFGWPSELVQRTLNTLQRNGQLIEVRHPAQTGLWLARPELT